MSVATVAPVGLPRRIENLRDHRSHPQQVCSRVVRSAARCTAVRMAASSSTSSPRSSVSASLFGSTGGGGGLCGGPCPPPCATARGVGRWIDLLVHLVEIGALQMPARRVDARAWRRDRRRPSPHRAPARVGLRVAPGSQRRAWWRRRRSWQLCGRSSYRPRAVGVRQRSLGRGVGSESSAPRSCLTRRACRIPSRTRSVENAPSGADTGPQWSCGLQPRTCQACSSCPPSRSDQRAARS